MKVGDLVRIQSEYHNYMGIIMEHGIRDILVAWYNGEVSWVYKFQVEVINDESR